MRARSAAMHAEAVAAVAALRRCSRRSLTIQRARRATHSFALAVGIETATHRRARTGNGSRRSLGVGANNHAARLRDCGVRDPATDETSVHDLRCGISAGRLRSGASWRDRSSNAQREDNGDRSHAVPYGPLPPVLTAAAAESLPHIPAEGISRRHRTDCGHEATRAAHRAPLYRPRFGRVRRRGLPFVDRAG